LDTSSLDEKITGIVKPSAVWSEGFLISNPSQDKSTKIPVITVLVISPLFYKPAS
jgi:hypothetical protein